MNTMREIPVGLGPRAYTVRVGPGLLARAGTEILPLLKRKRVAIAADGTVDALHGPTLRLALDMAGIAHETVTIPPGEAAKGFTGLERLTRALIAMKIERSDLVIALGGGVTGDLAGLAAGLVRRGLGFVQVPTTLLAQVDSSVGGKTAINVPEGKNLVGLFHQPRLVLADTAVLGTLPDREMRAGYAEIVKYGLLGDASFFAWLEANGAAVLARDPQALLHAVAHAVAMKAAIVARDETEQGERALLNLGHTFGHALEAATGYSGRLLHGEGVAIGMVLALALSARLGFCPPEHPPRVSAHLKALGLKTAISEIGGPALAADELLQHMAQDKKVADGRLTFILARGIGAAFVTQDVNAGDVRAVLLASGAA